MGDVIDLAKWKRQRNVEGRKALYVSHLTGKISGSHNDSDSDRSDTLKDRAERIKRITELLKQISAESEDVDDCT